jgi:dimethylglycine catabolism A
MPAHSYGFGIDTAGINDTAAYVGRRLRSGVAMVIVGEAEVPFGDTASRGQAPSRLAGAASFPLYRALADVVGRHGGVVLEQLYHPGAQVWYEEQRQAVAPSPVPQAISYMVPRALLTSEIEALKQGFAAAARTAVESGLQGIELKADQGKLHHQFLSRRYNRRSDAYGGKIESRARFLLECLEAMRREIGSGAILGVRLAGPITSPQGGGTLEWSADISVAELADFARIVERSGFADYISISGETNSTAWAYARSHGDEAVPPMTFRNVARELRRQVRLPLLLTGRIMSLDDAETLLSEDECDLVGMARALIADGDMLSTAWDKARPDLVRPCIGCNIACVGHTWVGEAVRCVLDPTCGREARGAARHATHHANIAVVGGGPAGLAFAAAASRLGSQVALFEREAELGGQMRSWSKLPNRKGILVAVDHWERILRYHSVTVTCGASAPAWAELAARYDLVLDATGGEMPCRPGDQRVRQIDARAAIETETGWEGLDVIVFDANRHIDAAGVALWLHEKGATVRVLSPFEYVGIGTDPVTYANRLGALREAQIVTMPLADLIVAPEGVEILDHSRNLVFRDSKAGCVVWCRNSIPVVRPLNFRAPVAIGESAGALGLEQVVRQAHDRAIALLCNDKGEIP